MDAAVSREACRRALVSKLLHERKRREEREGLVMDAKETQEVLGAIQELTAQRAALLKACLLAKQDIDYVLRAHPEVTGLAVRGEAKAAIDRAINLVMP